MWIPAERLTHLIDPFDYIYYDDSFIPSFIPSFTAMPHVLRAKLFSCGIRRECQPLSRHHAQCTRETHPYDTIPVLS
jgi:hypothetical protein